MPVQNTCVAPDLLTSASSFTCLSSQQLLAVIAYLLSTGAGGGGAATLTGIVNPNGVVVGTVAGQFYINTVTGSLWYWDANLAIWVELIA